MNSLDIVDVFDINNKHHAININVLAAEDTWETPSLILATAPSGGKVIFSQVTICILSYNYKLIFKYEEHPYKYIACFKIEIGLGSFGN